MVFHFITNSQWGVGRGGGGGGGGEGGCGGGGGDVVVGRGGEGGEKETELVAGGCARGRALKKRTSHWPLGRLQNRRIRKNAAGWFRGPWWGGPLVSNVKSWVPFIAGVDKPTLHSPFPGVRGPPQGKIGFDSIQGGSCGALLPAVGSRGLVATGMGFPQ